MAMTLEQGIAQALDMMLESARDDNRHLNCSVYEVFDWGNEKFQGMTDAEFKKISNYSEKTWAKLFKERFGFTDEEYITKNQQALKASLLPRERKLLEVLSELACESIYIDPINQSIAATYYKSGPLIVFQTTYAALRIREAGALEAGFDSLAQVIEFLETMKVCKVKRPKKIKSYSLYD